MKNFNKFFLAALASSVFFVSCSSDDDNGNDNGSGDPQGQYDNGLLILNEGNATSGSVTFASNDLSIVHQDIFKTANPSGDVLSGGYLNSVFFSGDRAFIVSGSANKITVVNRYTFEHIADIGGNEGDTDFNSPRYGVVVNGKAYVTNYADFNTGDDDFFTVINLSDYTTTKVALNNWSEKVIEENGKLYIANGYYGSGSSITVFNPNTNTKEQEIEIGMSPNSLEEENGFLYALGSNGTVAKLVKINLSNNTVASTIELPASLNNANNLVVENNKIYFTLPDSDPVTYLPRDTKVFSLDMNATTVSETPLFTTTAKVYGNGFAVEDGRIYITSSPNYSEDGKVYVYSLSGALQKEVTTGLMPNSIYFND